MMNNRPILFSAPMVLALLDGTKTQTRRVATHTVCGVRVPRFATEAAPELSTCPYGVPGDRLWVRETWSAQVEWPESLNGPRIHWWHKVPAGFRGEKNALRTYYSADRGIYDVMVDDDTGCVIDLVRHRSHGEAPRWQPSIHMPRWASRISLKITDVRVERLQDISEADARAEGCPFGHAGNQYDPPAADPWQGYGRASFSLLWEKINGAGSWDANPWVWVVSFKRIDEVPHD